MYVDEKEVYCELHTKNIWSPGNLAGDLHGHVPYLGIPQTNPRTPDSHSDIPHYTAIHNPLVEPVGEYVIVDEWNCLVRYLLACL
ncbi:hypothetical protein HYV70_02130 [Candidatus Uhrbacteria bacterium]|nr:hypothetical protein [Candidatus Uhrbacteria bacterium]